MNIDSRDYAVPEKILPIFDSVKTYNVLFGGRGGSKSWGVAACLLIKAYQKQRLVLCCREIQNSIRDSVHSLLAKTIPRLGLDAFYEVQKDTIIGRNGSRFIFKGLHRNAADVKSTEGIDDCWLEESQAISNDSLDMLIPTVLRKDDSQFYIVFNPDGIDDPVYDRFVLHKRDDALLVNVNYHDNPFFPKLLRAEMEYDRKNNYDKYLWIWEGQPRKISDALVFKGKFRVDNFETPENITEFYFGADWGFANDPTVLIRCFIVDNKLFIDYEAYGIGVEIVNIKDLFDLVPMSRKYLIRADSARPETISHVRNDGFKITRSVKGPKSIEDGIEFLRSFDEIVVHSSCVHTIDEFKTYSYKQDKRTGEVLPFLIDSNNHCIDSLRYGVEMVKFATMNKKAGDLRRAGL